MEGDAEERQHATDAADACRDVQRPIVRMSLPHAEGGVDHGKQARSRHECLADLGEWRPQGSWQHEPSRVSHWANRIDGW